MKYDAPRKFTTPPAAQDLDRLAESVSEIYRKAELGFPPQFKIALGIYRENFTLAFGEAKRVDTSGGQTIRALLPSSLDAASAGTVAVLMRLSTAGAIRVLPTFNGTVDGESYYDVPSERGAYGFLFDGRNWTSLRSSGLPGGYVEGDTIIIINNTPTWVPSGPGRLSVESDTVALFHLNDTLADSGSSAFAVTNSSGATRYTDILSNWRGLFTRGTGVTDRFQSTATNSAMAITGAMTVEFVCASSGSVYANSANLVVYHGTDTTGGPQSNNKAWAVEFWRSGAGAGAIRWHQQVDAAGAVSEYILDTEVPPTDKPFFFAATRTSGQVVQFYINGTARGAASGALTTASVGANGRLRIGGATHDSFALAELRISNTARSATQIKEAFNTVLGGPYGILP